MGDEHDRDAFAAQAAQPCEAALLEEGIVDRERLVDQKAGSPGSRGSRR
ncbi:MAG: hypothetical protein R3F16_17375 [Myxococcota bacterium]